MYNHVKRWKKNSSDYFVFVWKCFTILFTTKGRRLVRMLVDLANPTMNYPVYPLLTLQQTVSTLFMFSPLICCGNKSSPILVLLVLIIWFFQVAFSWLFLLLLCFNYSSLGCSTRYFSWIGYDYTRGHFAEVRWGCIWCSWHGICWIHAHECMQKCFFKRYM